MAARAKTYRAEAVINLPAAFLLSADFLGLLKPAAIGGVDVHVVLPNFSRSGQDTVLHPRAKIDWVETFVRQESEDDPHLPFGRAWGWGSEREFSATRILVLPKHRVTLRDARKLHAAAADWVQLLATWIEVIGRVDLYQERVRVDRSEQDAYVWVDKGKEPGKVIGGRRTIFLDLKDRALAITPRQWGRVLTRASADERPPEAHVFLRDARHARNIGRYRRSVLDSATAVEVGLAKIRDDSVSGSDARLGNYVRGKAQQIGGLTQFLSEMGRRLPERIQQEVGEPRNRAIHEGHEPSKETASKALGRAEEVVDLAFPWKSLL